MLHPRRPRSERAALTPLPDISDRSSQRMLYPEPPARHPFPKSPPLLYSARCLHLPSPCMSPAERMQHFPAFAGCSARPHPRSPAAAPPPHFLPSARRRVLSSAGNLRFLRAPRVRGGGTGPVAPAAPAGSRGLRCPGSTLRSHSSGADKTSATRGSGSDRGCRSAGCVPFSPVHHGGIHSTGSPPQNPPCTQLVRSPAPLQAESLPVVPASTHSPPPPSLPQIPSSRARGRQCSRWHLSRPTRGWSGRRGCARFPRSRHGSRRRRARRSSPSRPRRARAPHHSPPHAHGKSGEASRHP